MILKTAKSSAIRDPVDVGFNFGFHAGDRSSRIRMRTIHLQTGQQAAELIDVRAYPTLPLTFALADDFGVCRDAASYPAQGAAAVSLAPGAEYSTTILLDSLNGDYRKYSPPPPNAIQITIIVMSDWILDTP